MKVVDAKVNWYLDWGNSPELQILVDKLPDKRELVFKKVEGVGGTFYIAEKDGYVSFFYSNDNKTGFGGSEFVVKLEDGTTETVVGPWSSRAACVNGLKALPYEVVDVCIDDQKRIHPVTKQWYPLLSGHVTLAFAEEAAKVAGVKLIDPQDDESGPHYIPAGKEEMVKRYKKGA